MRKKKFIAMALVAMLSLSGLTGCSDKDKADISNKLNNKTTETTKKDDSKTDDKTSESKSDNKSDNKKSDSNSSSDKPANKPSSGNNGSASKPNSNKPADKPSKPNGNTGSNKSDSSTSKPSQSTEKPAETKPSQPAHQHTWVDHTATKQVPRTVHHDAVYKDVTIPAVTQTQEQCLGCKQWFSSLDDIVNHAMKVKMGMESGDPQRCGSVGGVEREVVITPAHTEHRLVKDAWDETVYDTQTYVDYQECTGCHEHRQK